MWSLEVIKHINREIGLSAKERGKVPYHLRHVEELSEMPPFPFPNIGDYDEMTRQYEHVTDLFCDKTGVGGDGELALTTEQLKSRLTEILEDSPNGIYLAIVEEGQFQLYVGVWR